MMDEDTMLYCLIAFILGWLVSRHVGNGFSLGSEEVMCDPTTSPKQFCPDGSDCPDCGLASCSCAAATIMVDWPSAYNVNGAFTEYANEDTGSHTDFNGSYIKTKRTCSDRPVYQKYEEDDWRGNAPVLLWGGIKSQSHPTYPIQWSIHNASNVSINRDGECNWISNNIIPTDGTHTRSGINEPMISAWNSEGTNIACIDMKPDNCIWYQYMGNPDNSNPSTNVNIRITAFE